ncbi:MAG TPA: ribosome maturation factor RimM [Anaerovoracaceae bacterium]|nr:ribosome maturation factor RimM [Anaerovoracaceae bacterium]
MDKIKVGQVVNVAGLKGELKVYHYTDYKERFEELDKVWLGSALYKLAGVRYVKDTVILKLAGIDSRTEAEKHRGEDVSIDKADVRKLPEGTYHIFDLIGLSVIGEDGCVLGVVSDVIKNSAQDLYEVERENKSKFLIPAVEEFILDIDLNKRTMAVRLIEGLMDI